MSSKQPAGAGSSRGGNRRRSLPSAMSQPSPSEMNKFMTPMMWPMNAMFNPYMMPGVPGPSAASGSQEQAGSKETATKPWDVSSDDSEDDFKPPKKRRTTASKTTKSQTEEDKADKKGPGRPTKAQVAERSMKDSYSKILSKYPPAFHTSDSVAYLEKDECPACRIFKGKVAFKPCGHCKYCYSCTNKLRTEALKLKRPAKCPSDNCFDLVEGWVQLFNVSA